MYKLIAIDLDGTLLDDKKEIPYENKKIIKKLIKLGYEVVIATGRSYTEAKRFISSFEEELVIIANNGNMIRHTKDDKLIGAKYLDNNHLERVLKLGKKKDLHPIIHIDGFEEGIDVVCELSEDDERYWNYIQYQPTKYKRVDNFLEEDLKILSIVYIGKYSDLYNFEKEINNIAPNDYKIYLMENISLAEALLEVINPIGNKWNSIKEYAKSKDINQKEIITLGDDVNDLEMIEKSGLGIAMKNSVDEIKDISDVITEKNNNEAGLAYELQRILNI